MEALKLAFDTIIVGALAIPWLILLIGLFQRRKEAEKASTSSVLSFLAPFLDGDDKHVLGAAGVFVFAATYFVGAAITRVSGDFFNDDDLWIPYVRLPTEDNIRTDVYCDPVVRELVRAGGGENVITTPRCQQAAKTWRSRNDIDRDTAERAKKDIQRTFYRQEAAVLAPSDDSDRLNQFAKPGASGRGIRRCHCGAVEFFCVVRPASTPSRLVGFSDYTFCGWVMDSFLYSQPAT